MKVASLHSASMGLAYHRIWKPRKWIERYGAEILTVPDKEHWIDEDMDKLDAMRNEADVLFVQYETNPKACIYGAAMARGVDEEGNETYLKPLIVDIDDNLFDTPVYHPNFKDKQKGKSLAKADMVVPPEKLGEALKVQDIHKGKEGEFVSKLVNHGGQTYITSPGADHEGNVKHLLKRANLVTTTCETLANLYRPYCDRVAVLPNGIDFEEFPKNKRHDDGLIRIGVFGSIAHKLDWYIAVRWLPEILKKYPNVRILTNTYGILKEGHIKKPAEEREYTQLWHQSFEEFGLKDHPQVENYAPCDVWDWNQWLADKGCDIGLAPLVDDKFSRGKSNLKFLEFGALGIPGVYSYVEPFKMVNNGVDGFTAKEEQFKDRMIELIENEELRKRMGQAAYERVKKDYNMANIGRDYLSEIDRTIKDFSHIKGSTVK